MSLASQVTALATRIGQEFKARAPLVSRITTGANTSATGYGATGLTVTLLAGKTYEVRAWGHYRTAATTTGIGLRLNGTAVLTATPRITVSVWNANTATHVQGTGLPTANLTTAVTAANTDYPWEVTALMTVTTGGTLTIEFASEVNASRVDIFASYLIANPIG